MSFESVYNTSYGTIEVQKIASFIKSLSIKNQYDADKYETTESESNYHKNFFMPYFKLDSFYDYTVSELKKINSVAKTYSGEGINDKYLVGTDSEVHFTLDELYSVKDPSIVSFLDFCRRYKVVFYDELNRYYAQYDGLPLSTEQVLNVPNFDGDLDENNYPLTTIPIHKISKTLTPITYRNMFVINKDYEDPEFGPGITYYKEKNPDYIYLRFIDKKPIYLTMVKDQSDYSVVNFYTLRTCPNYTMLNWDETILSDKEFFYFTNSYERAVSLINNEYFKSFDDRFDQYNKLMIFNLLRYTIMFYSNTYIEKYSLHDYSLQNIYNILDSNNLSKLKNVNDKNKLYKLIKLLDDLIIIKGSNEALSMIITDVLGEDLESLRICYLQREYPTDGRGFYSVDNRNPVKPKLVIRETSLKDSSNLDDVYHDYDEFVSDDTLWGGGYDQYASMNDSLKAEVKKEIIERNIDNIQTKHILFRKIVNLMKINTRQHDNFCMLIKYLTRKYSEGNVDSPIHKESIDFDGFTISPSVAFATLTYFHNLFTRKKIPYQLSEDEVVTPGKRGKVNTGQYSRSHKFYSTYFDDPVDMTENIDSFFNERFKYIDSSDGKTKYLKLDTDGSVSGTDGGNIYENMFYYELVNDMFQKGMKPSDERYIYYMITNIFNGTSTIPDYKGQAGRVPTYDYIFNYNKDNLVRIMKHLWVDYSNVGSDGTGSDKYFDECILRYKEGRFPLSFTGTSTDLYIFDNTELELPVSRDNSRTYNDVVREFIRRKYLSDKQKDYIMWCRADDLGYEDIGIIDAFFNIHVDGETYEYDNIVDFISGMSESFISYLYTKGIVGYTAKDGFKGIDLNTIEDSVKLSQTIENMKDIETRLMISFREWVQTQSVYQIISTIDELTDTSYVEDIKLLIEEFVSIFKELKTVVYEVESNLKYKNVLKARSDAGSIKTKYNNKEGWCVRDNGGRFKVHCKSNTVKPSLDKVYDTEIKISHGKCRVYTTTVGEDNLSVTSRDEQVRVINKYNKKENSTALQTKGESYE